MVRIADVNEYYKSIPDQTDVEGLDLNLEPYSEQGFYKFTYVDREKGKIAHRPKDLIRPNSVTEGLTMYNNYRVLEDENVPLPGSYNARVTSDQSVPVVWMVGDFNESLVSLDYLGEDEIEARRDELLELGSSIKDLVLEGRVVYGEPTDSFNNIDGIRRVAGYDIERDQFVVEDVGELPSEKSFDNQNIPADSREEFLRDRGLDAVAERILSEDSDLKGRKVLG